MSEYTPIKEKYVLETKVILALAEDYGYDISDGGKYILVCERHGDFTQDTDKKRLWKLAKSPDYFCEECRIDDRVTL